MISFGLKSTAFALLALLCASTCSTHAQAQEAPQRELRVMVDANFQAAMLKAVNAERAKQGLAAFCTNKKLQAASQLHSEDQAKNNFMSHTGSSGSSMSDRISAQSFKWNGIAENVAAGQVDVTSVMQSWMTSDGHRANIMGNYKFFGTGYAYNAGSTYKHYWTQDFGTGSSEVCDDGSASTPAPASQAPPATQPPAAQTPVYTPAPTTKAPPATQPPAAQTPVYTSKPTTAPPATTASPATAPPATTASPATKAPVYTSKPVVSRAPHKSRPAATKKVDCKPIY